MLRDGVLRAAVVTGVLLLSACSPGAPTTQPTPEPASATDPTPTAAPDGAEPPLTLPEEPLRDVAPEGVLVGVAVAGGGHHADLGADPFTTDERLREVIAQQFSSVSPENQMKWEAIHPEPGVYDFDAADAVVEFAEQNGQAVRGHALMWHSQNPDWLEDGDHTPEELRAILEEHVRTVVGRYAGRIQQWDVANEVIGDDGALRTGENIWLRELGPEVLGDVFRWANEADPDALLFLNDYGVEDVGPKSDAYLALAGQLLADGVPLHGFGVQGHLSTEYGPPRTLAENLGRFADLGLMTAVTELDVRVPVDSGGVASARELARQADYHATVVEGCLAVESCTSITLWGVPDAYSWVPHFFPGLGAATVMGDDFAPKPAFLAVHEALAAGGTA